MSERAEGPSGSLSAQVRGYDLPIVNPEPTIKRTSYLDISQSCCMKMSMQLRVAPIQVVCSILTHTWVCEMLLGQSLLGRMCQE